MTLSTLKFPALAAALLMVACLLAGRTPLYGAEAPVSIPPPAVDNPKEPGAPQTAVLAAGCFWGVQGVFEHVRGVRKVVSGYAGGDRSTAQYETVSTGATGHAESVMITFDPAQISYGQLLQIAFSVVHDPTQLNRQGPDVGSQYRSAIFVADADQRNIAESYIAQLNGAHAFPRPITTRIEPLKGFYQAEGYHQDYLVHHPDALYIEYNDLPKVANLERVFPALYNRDPVLTTSPGLTRSK
jgi:peptide-methionine (S)-S-oxide reductase